MSKYTVSYVVLGFGGPDSVECVLVEASSKEKVVEKLEDVLLNAGMSTSIAAYIINYGAYTVRDCEEVDIKL